MNKGLVIALIGLSLMMVGSPAQAADPVFFINCPASHTAPDDPIVFPSQPGASHMHQFFGNRTVNSGSTYSEMVVGGTSCALVADTAGYWVPVAYQGVTELVPRSVNVYYRPTTAKLAPDVAFPADFRMVAGSGRVANQPRVGTADLAHVYWNCGPTDSTKLAEPTQKNCGSKQVRANILFPACWDGVLTGVDDTSHVAYAVQGVCPAGFAIKLPRLAVVVQYQVSNVPGLALSSGDPTTLHADFWNTWNQPVLEERVATCLRVPSATSCGRQAG
jgi:uncharacterized protein DUF1996